MSKIKKVLAEIKLTIPAGKANPQPPIGPALGQRGLNIMDFCKKFNERTSNFEQGTPIPVVISAFEDKTFEFILKTPPVSYFLKKFAKIEKGAKATKKDTAVGTLTMNDCREIAKIKMCDMNANDIEAASRMVKGSAEAMGIEIIEG